MRWCLRLPRGTIGDVSWETDATGAQTRTEAGPKHKVSPRPVSEKPVVLARHCPAAAATT